MQIAGRVLTVALVCASSQACHTPQPRTSGSAEPASLDLKAGEIKRTLVASQPATALPGWETQLYLIEYGPGASAPLHVHPVVGVGRVLEGSFVSAFGNEQPVEVRAGQGFVDQAGVPHRIFRNTSDDQPLRFVIAYTIRPTQRIFYPGDSLPPAGN
ncbi:MAG TPA: cupin domain-containing protein [Polyangiaceae bacterium]|nr:cupin domain-containing protein [Polyangiaceae bacterium]